MKIMMLTTAAGPEGSYQAGQELEVGMEIPNKLAEAFVAGGYARKLDKAAVKKPEVSKLVVEMAVAEPAAEKAVVEKAAAKAVPVKPAKKPAKK
jgi:ribosomal protein L5